MLYRSAVLAILLAGWSLPLMAQGMPSGHLHTPGMRHDTATGRPTEPGQAAFAAIAEIVRLLEADAATDWSTVDLHALREHLRDMDDLTLRADVQAAPVAGGLTMEVTGAGRVAEAIQRMVPAHAPMLEAAGPWTATVAVIPGGVRLTVVARESGDAATQARIRGLGFIGLMVQGAHHTEHHLMIARGAGERAHRH